MFQINEKSVADNRTLITINDEKENISAILKNGTINYSMDHNILWLTTPKVRQAYIKQQHYQDFLDRILIARNGVDIDGAFSFDDNTEFKQNVEIKQNLLIRGNITIEGDSSIVDTPTLSIEDNIIELNRNEKGNGILLKNAGMAINRGTKPFARYLFSEQDKAFILDTSSSMDADINVPLIKVYSEAINDKLVGQVDILRKLAVPEAVINNLLVTQDSNLNTLTVNGLANFKNEVIIDGLLTAKNNVLIYQNLTVNENAFFKKNVAISNSLTTEGTSFFNSLATFNQGVLIKNGLTVSTGGANITGNSTISGTLTVTDNVTFNKNLNVTDTVTSKNSNVSAQLTAYNALINNNLQAKGPVTIDGTLTSNNTVTLNGSNLTVNSLTNITKDTTISGSNLTITTKSDGTSGNLYVKGNTEITKDLNVSGNINFAGNTTVSSKLIANDILSNNNVSVASGNGKGFRFWDSDAYKIYMSTTGDTSYGGSISGSSASDYNMYFKMTGGTNRGFVFKSDTNSLVQIESTGTLRAINHIYAKGSQVLRHADMGHQPANNTPINACMIDGKHYTDLVNQFVDVAGDTMTGKLAMNSSIDMTSDNPITFNSKINSNIKAFGTNKEDLLISSTNRIYFYPAGTSSKEMILKEDGNLSVLGSNVLRQADEGHGKGIDADTVDGYHLNQNVLTTSSPTFYDLNLNRRVAGTKTSGSVFTDGQNTSKTYLNFIQASGSNALGKIYHESSSYSSDINKGVLHLCPSVSNDNSLNYVSIHGSNSAESIKLYTGGNIYAPGTITAPTFSGSLSGNASSATKLQTARTINGTNFNGTANITTSYWGTARTITLGRTAKSVNGSADMYWSTDEIGALDKYNDSTLADGKKICLGSSAVYLLSGQSPELVSNTNIILKADADASTTTEYAAIKAGHNELRITSSSGGTTVTQGQDKLTFNGNIVYHAGRKPTPSEVGAVSKAGDTMTGRLTANGKISIPTTGGMWITGMTLDNASIAISAQQTTGSYHPVLAVKTSGNHVVNLGGLGDDFGFYGYKSGRTENGTDWSFRVNASNGNISGTGSITAPSFIGALSGNASTATKLQTARTLTVGNTGKSFDGSVNVSWSLAEIGAFGKQGEVNATTNWNNLRTPGVYKVQMSAWGATSLGGPNNFSSSLYNYGILCIYQSNVAHEERTIQTYYPHKSDNSHPIVTRMYNSTAWTSWSKIGRGLNALDVGALALTGGTLTGNLSINNSGPLFTLKNTDGGDTCILFDRSPNANWRIRNSSGTLCFECDYTSSKGTSYYTGAKLVYNSGDFTTKGEIYAVNGQKVYHTGNFNPNNYIPLTGSTSITGTLRTSGEYQTTSANGLRIVQGNYGVFLRNDGNNTYFLITNSGDQYGNWNNLRPWSINNATGLVTFGNGLKGALDGNSSTATKLQTARSISLTGDTSGSVSFDGSSNVTLTARRRVVKCGNGGTVDGSNVYFKVGTFYTSNNYTDARITFFVTSDYSSRDSGILSVKVRRGGSVSSYDTKEISWIVADSINKDNFYLLYGNDGTTTKFEIWVKSSNNYTSYRFNVIDEGNRDNYNNPWTLYDSNVGQSALPAGFTIINSSIITSSNNSTTASKLQTARGFTIGNTKKSFDGSADVSWSLSEIGAAASSHSHNEYTLLTGSSRLLIGTSSSTDSNNAQIEIQGPSSGIARLTLHSVGRTKLSLATISGDNLQFTAERNGVFRVLNANGYLDIGTQNGTYAHYNTDRANHWFNKTVRVAGDIYAGTNYDQKVYHTGNKPTPADIGAAASSHNHDGTYMKQVNANSYWGMTANGDTSNWVRTTVSGIIPYASGGASSLGTSSWPFSNIYANNIYDNGTLLENKFAAASHSHKISDLTSEIFAGGNDLNTYSSTQTWVCRTLASTTNRPADYYTVVNFGANSASNFQLAHSYGNSSTAYIRGRHDTSSNYTPWAKIYTDKDKPTPADIGAMKKGPLTWNDLKGV